MDFCTGFRRLSEMSGPTLRHRKRYSSKVLGQDLRFFGQQQYRCHHRAHILAMGYRYELEGLAEAALRPIVAGLATSLENKILPKWDGTPLIAFHRQVGGSIKVLAGPNRARKTHACQTTSRV